MADQEHFIVSKSVHIQAEYDARNPVEETAWLQSVADDPHSGGLPNGIVGYCDLSGARVEEDLEKHCQFPNFRGIRQILNRHADDMLNFAERDFISDDQWRRGFALLKKYELSFDLQIYPHQALDAALLADQNPSTQIILNHAGMPHDRTADGLNSWRYSISELSKRENVFCKISGLGMTDHHWTADSIRMIVLSCIEAFGVHRSMFASNFPVDKLFSTYDRVWSGFLDVISDFSENEKSKLLALNAERIYRI
jgi:predicted TIM-barrel fold metal-dependent hydrolase